jgi:hypothetical protein
MRFTQGPYDEVAAMKLTLSSITSGLVGGLVFSYVLFMGYILTVAQQPHAPPARIATMGCFSLGHCPLAVSSRPD